MGLTIHYEVRIAECDRARARALVQTMQRRACELRRSGKVDKVHSPTSERDELKRWASLWLTLPDPSDPHTIRGVEVPPLEGCIFPVSIGEDCEPLWLGLCRYPVTVRHDGREIATKLDRDWRFRSACKTQYASLHGWDHFYRCHTTVVILLRNWADLGAHVRIVDEGGWWPRRSDATLRRKLDEMNGIVAAVAGAVKDATDDDSGPPVVSPIFAHPQFEQLEAKGAARTGDSLTAAARIVTDTARRPRDGS